MTHPPLAELQRFVAEALRRERALDRDAAMAEAAARHVGGNDRLSPVEQLEIYREQFWLRHTSSLVEDFPGLGGIIGQSDWEKLVEGYLAAHVPTSWTLRNLGSDLPAFVERATWLPHHELCIDMTRLEWAYIELFDGPEAPPLDPAKVASVSDDAWERAVIVTSPVFRLLETRYPVAALRRALRERPNDTHSIPDARTTHLALYRAKNRSLYHKELSPGAYAMLQALVDGTPLIAAAERAAGRAPDEAATIESSIGAWFQDWGARGWIVDVVVP